MYSAAGSAGEVEEIFKSFPNGRYRICDPTGLLVAQDERGALHDSHSFLTSNAFHIMLGSSWNIVVTFSKAEHLHCELATLNESSRYFWRVARQALRPDLPPSSASLT